MKSRLAIFGFSIFGLAGSSGCVSICHRDLALAKGGFDVGEACVRPCESFQTAAFDRSTCPTLVSGCSMLGPPRGALQDAHYFMLGKHHEFKERIRDWIERKKLAANQPPWPKFHPIPSQPVFARREGESIPVPESFGTFGHE